MELSRRNAGLSVSLTLAISARAKEMRAAGEDVIGFGAGEPDFPTPDFIMDAAREALEIGFTRYTPVTGMKTLKEAVVQKFRQDNQLDYSFEQILISNGAKHSIFNALQAILNPGDEVIIPAPYWVSYPEMVKISGGKAVYLNTTAQNGFKIDPDELEKVVTSKTKAMIINSPNNPCGVVYDRDDLKKIADIALDKGFFIISDEIYEKIIYDNNIHISIASLGKDIKEQTIVVNGMSKAYAMTGWRIGFAAGPGEVIKVMGNVQGHSTSNPNSIAQYASEKGLRDPRTAEVVDNMVTQFNRRREYMVDKINNIPGLSCRKPAGAFYVLVGIQDFIGKKYQGKEISGSLDFSRILLEEEKVAIVPGLPFGVDEYIRLSYATDLESIKRGLDRIEGFVSKLEA